MPHWTANQILQAVEVLNTAAASARLDGDAGRAKMQRISQVRSRLLDKAVDAIEHELDGPEVEP